MSLERVLVHTSLFPSPLSVTVSRFHRSAPARTSLAEFWLLLFPPCHLALGTVGSPASYCFESGGFGTCKSQLQTPALYPLASGGGKMSASERVGGKTHLFCKDWIAREFSEMQEFQVQGPKLRQDAAAARGGPAPATAEKTAASPCWLLWYRVCLLCTGHLSQSSWAPLCGCH